MKKYIFLLVLAALLGLSACGSLKPGDSTGAPTGVPATELPTTTPEVFNPLPSDQRAFEAVRALLARQLGVDPLTIQLVKVEKVDWPDSCLRAPQPNEMCAMVITPGYRITVQQGGTTYEFHTDLGATNIRQAK